MTPLELYAILNNSYGNQRWWPAQTPYEVMVGAVLTQNTAWGNVEKAIAGFGGELTPERVASLPLDELKSIIRPAGFFNQKSAYLKTLTAWFAENNYDAGVVAARPMAAVRGELLNLRGIGPETADSILLYAFGFPTFVVDAYTRRLLTRLGIDVPMDYYSIKAYLESRLPVDAALYNNFHALIVRHANAHCRAKAACGGCPLKPLNKCI